MHFARRGIPGRVPQVCPSITGALVRLAVYSESNVYAFQNVIGRTRSKAKHLAERPYDAFPQECFQQTLIRRF